MTAIQPRASRAERSFRLTNAQAEQLGLETFSGRKAARDFIEQQIAAFRATTARPDYSAVVRRVKRLLDDVRACTSHPHKRAALKQRASKILLEPALAEAMQKGPGGSPQLAPGEVDEFQRRTRKALEEFENRAEELEGCVFAAYERLRSSRGHPKHGDADGLILSLCICWGCHSGRPFSGSRLASNKCLAFIKHGCAIATEGTTATISPHTIYPVLDQCVHLEKVCLETGLPIDQLISKSVETGIATPPYPLSADKDAEHEWTNHRDFVRFLHQDVRRLSSPAMGVTMKPTIDIDAWLEANAPSTSEELYSLYRAISDCGTVGGYTAFQKGSATFVKSERSTDALLMIVSNVAKQRLLLKLNKMRAVIDPTSDPDMTMEGWYETQRSAPKE